MLNTRRTHLAAVILMTGLLGLGGGVPQLHAIQSIEEVIHVDVGHPEASDENAGTRGEPLLRVQAAMERAVRNKEVRRPTRVVVHSGTYRETIHFGMSNYPGEYRGDPSNGTPIVVEAFQPGTVVVSGSDVWTDWRARGGSYEHEWPFEWGGADLLTRREMVFVDGQRMTPVLTRRQLEAGTFFVDESTATIHLEPPRGVSLQTALVEVAVRPVLWDQRYENNVTLRGLTFQHAADEKRGGLAAVRFSSSNQIAIEDCEFRSNSWTGLFVGDAEDVLIRGSTLNHNGGNGWGTWKVKDLSIEDSETSYNNWRGALAGHFGWDVGNKLESIHGLTVLRHKATGNFSRGLWLDYDIRDAVIEDAVVFDNHWDGLWFEASHGPITLRNSRICGNGRSGLKATYSEDVTLEGNVFYKNAVGPESTVTADNSQLEFGGEGKRRVNDFETGERTWLALRRWVIRDNVFVGTAFSHRRARGGTLVDTYLNDRDWNQFLGTVKSDRNVWYHGDQRAVFGFPRRKNLTFAQWQRRTDLDRTSRFQDPLLHDVCPTGE